MNTRSPGLELLDTETPPPADRARVVGYLAFVNRWLGGTSATAARLREFGATGSVLDVACGGADVLRDLAAQIPEIRPIALDLSAWPLDFASGLPRLRGDALRLPFRDRSVDYVICNHFFHHLSDVQIVAALREFNRVARRGIVVNDLLRTRRALFWITIFSLWANRYVKFDGPQSVRRAFTIPEVEALAGRAGLGWLRVRRHFGHRFTLAGDRKPD